MTTAIEEQLPQRLAELAEDAPATIHLASVTARVVERRRRRAAVRGTLVGLALVGVAAGLYAVQATWLLRGRSATTGDTGHGLR